MSTEGVLGGAGAGAAMGTAFGPIGTVVGAGIGGLLGYAGTVNTNEQNKDIAKENIALQRETNAKNEALMREQWAREDNAVLRRKKDLIQAGMSPLLAAGAAANAGPVVSQTAPKNNQVIQKGGLEAVLGGVLQGINAQTSYMDMMARQQQVIMGQQSLAIKQGEYDLEKRRTTVAERIAENTINWNDAVKSKQVLEMTKQLEIMSHNLDFAIKNNLPVGQAGDALIKQINQALQYLDGFKALGPQQQMVEDAKKGGK